MSPVMVPRITDPEKLPRFPLRAVIRKSIDWPCEVHHLFSDKNLGCRLGVTRAINWFFENVDEGIILEDDCIPHLISFLIVPDY